MEAETAQHQAKRLWLYSALEKGAHRDRHYVKLVYGRPSVKATEAKTQQTGVPQASLVRNMTSTSCPAEFPEPRQTGTSRITPEDHNV